MGRPVTVRIVQYCVAVALIVVILAFVDLRQILAALQSISLPYVFAAFVLAAAGRIVMGHKWAILLRAIGYRVSTWLATRVYIVAGTFAVVLPSTIGLDVARVYLVRHQGVSVYSAFASVFVERLLGIVALLVACAIGGAILIWRMVSLPLAGTAIAGVALLLASGLGFALLFGLPGLAQRWTFGPDTLRRVLSKADVALSAYRGRTAVLMLVFAWSLVEQVPHIVATYLLARALGIGVGLIDCVAVLPLVMLLDRLPISVDGIGVREGAMVIFFGSLGVPTAQSLLLSLLTRAVQWLFVGVGWILYVLYPVTSWKQAVSGLQAKGR